MAYPTKIKTNPLILRYQGIFDLDSLYQMVVEWFWQREYLFQEKAYKHKVPFPTGAEQEVSFSGDKKVTDYYKYIIEVDFHTWDQRDIEVNIDGAKKTLTTARIEIRIKGILELEHGIEKKDKLSKFLGNIYRKYIVRKEVESLWYDTLYYETYKLHYEMKKLLDMQTKYHEYRGYLGEQ